MKQPFFVWQHSLNLPGHGQAAVHPYQPETAVGLSWGRRVICKFEISECGVYILSTIRVQGMASSCEEYRYQQQLLALKKRLAEDKLNPEEQKEIERLVQELEKKLKM
jgi:hypothetical protein